MVQEPWGAKQKLIPIYNLSIEAGGLFHRRGQAPSNTGSVKFAPVGQCWLVEDRLEDAKRFERVDPEHGRRHRLRESFRESPFWRRLSSRRKQGWTQSFRPVSALPTLVLSSSAKTRLDNQSPDSLFIILVINRNAAVEVCGGQ
jgi:hypothetical protein